MRIQSLTMRIAALLALVAILAGCSSPTATPAPTEDLRPTFAAVETQAVQTAVAGMTQNAPTATPVMPTSTPAPTDTPEPTNTPLPPTAIPTATYIPWTSTPVVIATATSTAYSCTITEVTPKSTDTLKPRADFDGRWVVKNSGSQAWEAQSVDIVYVSGTKLQKKYDAEDLAANVASGDSLTVIVDMTAPADAGTYSTVWAIKRGSSTICTLSLTVQVSSN